MMTRPTIVLILCFSGSLLAGWTLTHRRSAAQGAASHVSSTQTATRIERSRNEERAMVAAAMAPVRAASDRWSAMKAVVELVHRIPPDQISRWLDKKLFQHSDETLKALFYQCLRERYLEIDPEDCIRGMLRSGDEIFMLQQHLAQWAAKDPESVLRLAQEMPDQRKKLVSAAITAFAKSDPERAYQMLGEIRTGTRGGDYYSLDGAYHTLAGNSPGQFLSRCEEWDKNIRETARQAVVNEWIGKDFDGCLNWLKDAPRGKEFFQDVLLSWEKFGGQWVRQLDVLPADWMAAVEKRGSVGSLTRGSEKEWLEADLEGKGFSAAAAQRFRSAALVNLARSHPEEAITRFAALGDVMDRKDVEMNFSLALARKNPELAKQWVESLGDTPNREALEKVIEESQQSPRISTVPPQRTPVEMLRDIADVNKQSSSLDASQWSLEQMGEVSREIGRMSAEQIAILSKKSDALYQFPHSVKAELISRQLALSPQEDQTNVVRNTAQVVSSWGRDDPEKASAWVDSLPAGESRRWAIINLSSHWKRDDPEAAEKWISRLPSEGDRKAAREEVKKPW